MNRGARRQNVFINSYWNSLFLELLGQAHERYGIRVHAFVLMPNHFHLMVESVNGNLSDAMRFVTSQFGLAFNKAHDLDGSVFRGRFKSRLVDTDRYWQHLLAYLHLNPVRANLVGAPGMWPWSSHHAYAGAMGPQWLETDELHSKLLGVPGYRKFLAAYRIGDTDPGDFDPSQLYRAPTRPRSSARTSPAATQTLEELERVARITGSAPSELQGAHPTPALRLPRMLAMWWLVRRCATPRKEAAELLGTHHTTVSRALKRMDVERGSTSTLNVWAAELLRDAGLSDVERTGR